MKRQYVLYDAPYYAIYRKSFSTLFMMDDCKCTANMLLWNLKPIVVINLRAQNGHLGHRTESAGPRLNIKTVLSRYGDFHVKDKTAVRTSYL